MNGWEQKPCPLKLGAPMTAEERETARKPAESDPHGPGPLSGLCTWNIEHEGRITAAGTFGAWVVL